MRCNYDRSFRIDAQKHAFLFEKRLMSRDGPM